MAGEPSQDGARLRCRPAGGTVATPDQRVAAHRGAGRQHRRVAHEGATADLGAAKRQPAVMERRSRRRWPCPRRSSARRARVGRGPGGRPSRPRIPCRPAHRARAATEPCRGLRTASSCTSGSFPAVCRRTTCGLRATNGPDGLRRESSAARWCAAPRPAGRSRSRTPARRGRRREAPSPRWSRAAPPRPGASVGISATSGTISSRPSAPTAAHFCPDGPFRPTRFRGEFADDRVHRVRGSRR